MPMDMKGNTILHFICVNHPPKYVLEKMFGFVEDCFDSSYACNIYNVNIDIFAIIATKVVTIVGIPS